MYARWIAKFIASRRSKVSAESTSLLSLLDQNIYLGLTLLTCSDWLNRKGKGSKIQNQNSTSLTFRISDRICSMLLLV
ncbi:unnamed protein product [Citrullus colocynthis]|uniref:Uncharacterized protein n=1 Tax=Citrullus colocynthis TaxID=252529 RepID=A0ABP0YCY1_9ROSI